MIFLIVKLNTSNEAVVYLGGIFLSDRLFCHPCYLICTGNIQGDQDKDALHADLRNRKRYEVG